MITDKGKEIISKYLLGQTTAYAGYISIGCGAIPRSVRFSITNKALTLNVATITTSVAHSFLIGESVIIDGVDEVFNGTYIITSVPLTTTFTYAKVNANVTSTASSGSATLNLLNKVSMDFEMTRVPIVSKGFVDDNGTTKVSFTAELPKENRFEITEIGLWSSGSNSLATSFDSRMIFNFSEPWQAHSTSISDIPVPSPTNFSNNQGDITTPLKIFKESSSNLVFANQQRTARKEGPRFLNEKIFLRGDSSIIQGENGSWKGENPFYSITNRVSSGGVATLTTSGNHLLKVGDSVVVNIATTAFNGTYTITARTDNTISYALAGTVTTAATTGTITWQESTHIHLNAINFDISKNAPSDKILLAFSLIDTIALGVGVNPDYVKILIEFYKNETSIESGYAKKEIYIAGTEFTNNRYKVIEIPISELITSSDFTSQQIRIARVFASVIYTTGGQQMTSPIHYVELEGLRLENETTENPVYGMVGYSVAKTQDDEPLYKYQNTNNYVEFRFNLDVG